MSSWEPGGLAPHGPGSYGWPTGTALLPGVTAAFGDNIGGDRVVVNTTSGDFYRLQWTGSDFSWQYLGQP